jgi:hypothetical protein
VAFLFAKAYNKVAYLGMMQLSPYGCVLFMSFTSMLSIVTPNINRLSQYHIRDVYNNPKPHYSHVNTSLVNAIQAPSDLRLTT